MERQTRHVYLNGSNVEIGRFRRRSQRRFVVHRIHNVTINRERWFQQQQQQGQEAQNWANANDRRCSFKTWPSCSISVVWKHDTQHTATRQQEAMSIVEMQKGRGKQNMMPPCSMPPARLESWWHGSLLSPSAIKKCTPQTDEVRLAHKDAFQSKRPPLDVVSFERVFAVCFFFFVDTHTHTHSVYRVCV